ncbi:fimbria/pilus periplasmic chaperone [Glaciimonas sp. Gout2]|uniref:fimbria/pilus periplasmic chaperone n=1 Tax=unclassified Glaciimonas TaxID=2644401 RepID=UPI002B2389D9|nr:MULTISPECIES: fimbria/pilus periplasmic chaperone [unclassified Glaciimonas]MEB0011482.1 fimbria/pilus periplasmic chaperone [Glaciimonas sp. Cout2]MEB0081486.1 fimbria/pilus periplasmic chaperone [Glaciimonas sp. Gout2]
MFFQKKACLFALTLACALPFFASIAKASVTLERLAVIVDSKTGEGVNNVKNTFPYPILLHSFIEDIPEDTTTKIIVSPPVVRIEPGETQMVRFMLNGDQKSKKDTLKRAVFEAIPPESTGIKFVLQQAVPLFVHVNAAEQENAEDTYKKLQWTRDGKQLNVVNNSNQVVMFMPQLTLLPSKEQAVLSGGYLLPGQQRVAVLSDATSAFSSLSLLPVNDYGHTTKEIVSSVTDLMTKAPT